MLTSFIPGFELTCVFGLVHTSTGEAGGTLQLGKAVRMEACGFGERWEACAPVSPCNDCVVIVRCDTRHCDLCYVYILERVLVEEFYGTWYQSGSFSVTNVRSGFSLPA